MSTHPVLQKKSQIPSKPLFLYNLFIPFYFNQIKTYPGYRNSYKSNLPIKPTLKKLEKCATFSSRSKAEKCFRHHWALTRFSAKLEIWTWATLVSEQCFRSLLPNLDQRFLLKYFLRHGPCSTSSKGNKKLKLK